MLILIEKEGKKPSSDPLISLLDNVLAPVKEKDLDVLVLREKVLNKLGELIIEYRLDERIENYKIPLRKCFQSCREIEEIRTDFLNDVNTTLIVLNLCHSTIEIEEIRSI